MLLSLLCRITSANSQIEKFNEGLQIAPNKESNSAKTCCDFTCGSCKRSPKRRKVLPTNRFASLHPNILDNLLCTLSNILLDTIDISSIMIFYSQVK